MNILGIQRPYFCSQEMVLTPHIIGYFWKKLLEFPVFEFNKGQSKLGEITSIVNQWPHIYLMTFLFTMRSRDSWPSMRFILETSYMTQVPILLPQSFCWHYVLSMKRKKNIAKTMENQTGRLLQLTVNWPMTIFTFLEYNLSDFLIFHG